MSNRFHNKFHRHNHHTRPTDREGLYPDSAYDPIASPESPFQGDFYLSGNFVALSSVFIRGTLDAAVAEFGDLTIKNNFTVLGSNTTIDSYLFCLSAVEIIANGPFLPALKVSQRGSAPIAYFLDSDGDKPIVFDTTGQVGIGIANPAATLHVVQLDQVKDAAFSLDSAYTNSKISLQTPSYNTAEILFKTPYTTHAKIASNPALSSLTFSTNNAERINIASDGKVDIFGSTKIIANDSNPSIGGLTLVKPTSAFQRSDLFLYHYSNVVPGTNPSFLGGGLVMRTAGGTYESPTSTLSGRVGFIVGSSTNDGVTWNNSSAIHLGIESNATLLNHNSYISFETLSGGFTSSRTEKMRITSTGNVGIGTATPVAKFNVTGTTFLDGTVTIGRQDPGQEGAEIRLCRSLDNTSEWVIDAWGAGAGTRLRIHKDLGGEKMTILDNGNIGIGLINPISKLHVNGVITLGEYQGINSVNNATNLFIAGGSNWDKGGCINLFGPNSITVGGDPGSIAFGTGTGISNTERMRITSNGDIGIGTISPGAKLEISSVNSNLWLTRGDGLPGVIVTRSSNGALSAATATTFNNQLGVWASQGHTGSGFASLPSTAIRTIALENFTPTANGAAILFETTPVGSSSASRTEQMRIDGNGKLGLGTTTPNEKLTVVGNISSNGELINLYNPNGEAAINIKSDGASGSSILRLNNGIDNTTRARIVWQKNDLPYARIYGYDSLSALSIETENIERIRFSKNGADIYGNLTIQGDLSSTGNQYFANTFFTTTSAISVVNISPVADVPAFYIAQSGPGDIASFYDLDQGVEVLHVGGANGNFPNVGIKNSAPNKDLTVKGEISATSTIWDPVGNSVLWNSVYNWVRATSATWQGTGQLVGNTATMSAAVSLTLSQSSTDIELIRAATAVQEVTAISGGVKGITYTLTNKTPFPITIYSSPSIIIRRGNAWISNTTSLSGSYLVLPLNGSCSVRADTNFVSLW